MWLKLTGVTGGEPMYINMNKVYEFYARRDGTTVLEYGNGNEIHVEETPANIMRQLNV